VASYHFAVQLRENSLIVDQLTASIITLLAQQDPLVAKAAFSIRRTTCRANGIRQFYLEVGPARQSSCYTVLETSVAWRFQMPALAPEIMGVKPAAKAKSQTG
jgi:hypothetical protein